MITEKDLDVLEKQAVEIMQNAHQNYMKQIEIINLARRTLLLAGRHNADIFLDKDGNLV